MINDKIFILGWSNPLKTPIRLEVKNALMDLFLTNMQLFYLQTLSERLDCGLLVDYCDVFISCLDCYSNGTHSLQRIHWWASDVMLHFSKSVLLETNSSTVHLGWPECEHIFSKFSFFGELLIYSVMFYCILKGQIIRNEVILYLFCYKSLMYYYEKTL